MVVLLMRRWVRPLGLAGCCAGWASVGCSLQPGFTGATTFPGYAAALPVIATAAMIVAGDTGRVDPSDLRCPEAVTALPLVA
jgi:peptidoglycan/LPS O-acetylase OafA/YrhL